MTPIHLTPHDEDILTRTVIGEADNQPDTGMVAVAHVVFNRVVRPISYLDRTVAGACLRHAQFSCWLPGPLADRIGAVSATSGDYLRVNTLVKRALTAWNGGVDLVHGARFYYNPAGVTNTPSWAKGHTPTVTIGAHRFFNV